MAVGKTRNATFAAGCFWGVEATFRAVHGIVETAVGFMGGTFANPTYEDVYTDKTGHAEVVHVEYEPSKVSYRELLDVFWKSHDATTPNRQGEDVGTRYRSAVFFHDSEQEAIARASRDKMARLADPGTPIVTEVTAASTFYRAEEYHQQYFEKRGVKATPGLALSCVDLVDEL